MILNKQGQALVEFVLLLPILLLLLFAFIDFSSVFYNKNHLEGVLNDTVDYVLEGKSVSEINKIIDEENVSIDLKIENDIATVKLTKEIKLITPFSDIFISNPFIIETERTVLYE